MTKAILISAFPGTGKTYLTYCSIKKILDSDSSKFDKKEFPKNYINHINENIYKVDIILISSHNEVRKALVDNGLEFLLVYPDITLKNEYLQRYRKRGSDEVFIKLLELNWYSWIYGLQNQDSCIHVVLQSGLYLSDYLKG